VKLEILGQPSGSAHNLCVFLLCPARITIAAKYVAFTRTTVRSGLRTIGTEMGDIAFACTVFDCYIVATVVPE